MLVKNFARSVYEIGRGDFSGFVEDHRYKPRADYLIYMETQLVKNYETNQLLLVDLFRETEESLFGTFTTSRAPYLPNYMFR
jgi:hypothetical protein